MENIKDHQAPTVYPNPSLLFPVTATANWSGDDDDVGIMVWKGERCWKIQNEWLEWCRQRCYTWFRVCRHCHVFCPMKWKGLLCVENEYVCERLSANISASECEISSANAITCFIQRNGRAWKQVSARYQMQMQSRVNVSASVTGDVVCESSEGSGEHCGINNGLWA